MPGLIDKKKYLLTLWVQKLVGLAMLIGMLAAVSGCQSSTASLPLTPPPVQGSASTSPPEESGEPTKEPLLITPTPAPTATPGRLDVVVTNATDRLGIADVHFLGLSGTDLINLLISFLIVLLGSALGVLIIKWLLRLVKHTPSELDDQLLATGEKPLRWLVILFSLQIATARLAFLNPKFKQWLELFYLTILIVILTHLTWKWVNIGLDKLFARVYSPKSQSLYDTLTPVLRRSIQALIYIVGLGIILQNLGVNLSAILAVLGIGVLAISLAVKETLTDMVSGFIILVDRPFHIGDRIKVEDMDTWGDVEAIGSRTTRIRTPDNRLVLIPNSVIGRSRIENYSYPDPSYMLTLSLGIGYGSDLEKVREIVIQAIQSVPGLLESKLPTIDLFEFGDSAMIFRATYWLKTYKDLPLRGAVNRAVIRALEDAKIDMPFITYDINLAYKEPPPRKISPNDAGSAAEGR